MNTKITLVELARLMAEATSTKIRVCELFLRELFATISQALINGESVKVKGIGTFKVTAVKPRKSVNVTTGDAMDIKAYKKVTFTPDKSLAEALNQPFAQFETVFLNDDVSDEKLAEIDEQYPSFLCDETEPLEPAPELEPEAFPEPEFIPQAAAESSPAAPAADTKPEQKPEPKPEPVFEPKVEAKPEPEPAPAVVEEPAIEEPVGRKALAAFGAPIAAEPEPAREPVEKPVERPLEKQHAQPSSTPAAVSKPQPVEQDEEDDGFRRPAPRNTYTPTQEQISRQQSSRNRRKLLPWLVLAAVVLGVVCWLFTRGGGKAESDPTMAAVVDSDSIAAVAQEAVITDTVTAKIVLSTLSDKYYDSPWFWVYIYEENKAIISDPNNVTPGTAVVIPPAEKYGIDANDPASLKKAQRRSWEILTQGKR